MELGRVELIVVTLTQIQLQVIQVMIHQIVQTLLHGMKILCTQSAHKLFIMEDYTELQPKINALVQTHQEPLGLIQDYAK